MENLSKILPITLKNMGLQKKYNAQSAIINWKKIVGNDIAANAFPKLVQHGTLIVAVNNSVWCHHLSMMKESIMDKINSFVGEKLIFDIRFQAGYLKNWQNEEHTEIEEDEKPNFNYKLSKVQLDECDVQIMHDTVDGISDKYLKQKILRLMRKDCASKKIRKQHNWHQCASCSTLCQPDEMYCTACKLNKKHEVLGKIVDILKEIPWIRYNELNKHLNCTYDEFRLAKHSIIAAINRDIQNGDNDKFKVMSFIMLTTGAKIEAVNEAIINKTLEKFRRKK